MSRNDLKNKNQIIENCILSLAEGDMDAMDLLYDTIYGDVLAFALSKVGDRFDADDILHDTFLRIYENAKLYTPMGKPLVWIFTVETNLINRYFQVRNRTVPLEDEILVNTVADDSSNETENMKMESMEKILMHLNEFERQVVMLHLVSDLKFREIAKQLDKPLSTVLSKYNRAIKKLQKIVKEEK